MMFWFSFIATYVFALITIGIWAWGAFVMLRFGASRAIGGEPDKWAFLRRWLVIVSLFALSGFIATMFSEILNEVGDRQNS